jgi:hypothetical protein
MKWTVIQTSNGLLTTSLRRVKNIYAHTGVTATGYASTLNNDPLNRLNNTKAVKTYSIDALKNLTEPLSFSDERINPEYRIPCQSITLSQENTWNYLETYEQNSLESTRFTYNQASSAEITINGEFLAPATGTDKITPTDVSFIFSLMWDIIENYHDVNYSYIFEFNFINETTGLRIKFGKYWLPVSLNISCSGKGGVSAAKWTAKFISPYIEIENDTVADLPMIEDQFGLRTLNTKDFYLTPVSGSPTDKFFKNGYLVDFGLDINLNWKKIATSTGYLKQKIPTYTWWSIDSLKSSAKFDFLSNTLTKEDFLNINRINRTSVSDVQLHCIPYNFDLSLGTFYFQKPSLSLATDELVVYSINGDFRKGDFF